MPASSSQQWEGLNALSCKPSRPLVRANDPCVSTSCTLYHADHVRRCLCLLPVAFHVTQHEAKWTSNAIQFFNEASAQGGSQLLSTAAESSQQADGPVSAAGTAEHVGFEPFEG